jgi:tetratricopeptide (TPR) repeat protein
MWRGHRYWVVLVLAEACFAPVANAQNIDPTSGQNVAGTASAVDFKGIQIRRKQLFAQMLTDPSNLDVAFEYAALSERAGDLEGAIATLERMLVFAPGLPRLQYELGVLYYRLGSFNTARSYFTTVLASPDVPDEIRTQIGGYIGTIKERERGNQNFGVVSTGVRYQTNANAGPDSALISLNGSSFTLDPGALGAPDSNGFVTARLHNSTDLESQGDRFEIDLSGYGALYASQTGLNTGLAELAIGPNLNLQRYRLDNARLSLRAVLGAAFLGGDPYYASMGVHADLKAGLDARTRLTLGAEARNERYFDSDARPNVSERSGPRYSTSARFDYVLNPELMLFAAISADRAEAEREYLSSWRVGGTLGLAWELKGLGDPQSPWHVTASLAFDGKLADAPDPVISLTDAERTSVATLSTGLSMPLSAALTLEAAAFYAVSSSNYDMSNYDNLGVSLALSRRF